MGLTADLRLAMRPCRPCRSWVSFFLRTPTFFGVWSVEVRKGAHRRPTPALPKRDAAAYRSIPNGLHIVLDRQMI